MASKSISKSVIWQLLGKFLLQGIAFFTTPIFTRILTTEDYGYTALYYSWLSIFSLIIGLQTHGSIANARIREDIDMDLYLSSIMTISSFSFLILLILSLIFNKTLSNLLSIKHYHLSLLMIQSFTSYIVSFYISKLDAYKEVEKSTIISLVQTSSCIILAILFVLIFRINKADAKIYGQAIPTVILGIVFFIGVYVKGKTLWNSSYTKFCMSFTFPLLIHGIGHLIFVQSDKIMLQKMISVEMLGIYSVSYTLCNVLVIIIGALNNAWLPFYYDYKLRKEYNEIVFHSVRYIRMFSIITAGFLLLACDVYKIMAPANYYSGIQLLPLLGLSNYFSFLYLFPVNNEFFYEKTKLIPIGTIIVAGINIFINFLLIKPYGIIGAAIGTLIAHILLFIFHWIISKYFIKERYEYKISMFIPYIIMVLVITVISYFFKDCFIIRWIIALFLGVYLLRDIIKNRSFF